MVKSYEIDHHLQEGWEFGKISLLNGEKIGNSKLTNNDVKEIKTLLNIGLTQSKIANKFNVRRETISKIKLGLIWSHI
jgi:DNA invertase Pin-like site-specific DNA recombinase